MTAEGNGARFGQGRDPPEAGLRLPMIRRVKSTQTGPSHPSKPYSEADRSELHICGYDAGDNVDGRRSGLNARRL